MALKVGIQLYSVRQSLKADPYGTLARVAEAGYKYIEAANHEALSDPGVGFGVPASKMRAILERLGMSIIGCQIYPLEPERLGEILDYHQAVGNSHIGYDMGFYPYNDIDFILRQCIGPVSMALHQCSDTAGRRSRQGCGIGTNY